jgi:uncharacterized membrane protein YkvA (DUF1232 family)
MFSRLSRLIRATGRDALVLWYACRNPHVPGLLKLAAILLGIYTVSPIDLVPDTLPLLGWLDDATLLALFIPAILKFVPQGPLEEANAATDRLLSRWLFWRTP